ncbi:hypothetical protein [Rhodoplanes sp. SY1]
MNNKHTPSTSLGRAPVLARISSAVTTLLVIDLVLIYLPATVAAFGGGA